MLDNVEELFQMISEFELLKSNGKIYKNDILEILKSWASTISIFDIMNATVNFRKNCQYVQENYMNHLSEIYIKNFYLRIKDIPSDNEDYDGDVNKNDFFETLKFLKSQIEENIEDKDHSYQQSLIYYLICIYTTYVLEEPIHPEGSVFPGNTSIRYDNGVYLCPVKQNNSENPKAVCKFCIAIQG